VCLSFLHRSVRRNSDICSQTIFGLAAVSLLSANANQGSAGTSMNILVHLVAARRWNWNVLAVWSFTAQSVRELTFSKKSYKNFSLSPCNHLDSSYNIAQDTLPIFQDPMPGRQALREIEHSMASPGWWVHATWSNWTPRLGSSSSTCKVDRLTPHPNLH